MASDKLKKLHTALIDTRNGYQEAVKDTTDPTVAKLSQDMIALRNSDHQQLHAALTEAGEKPDDKGSFMTSVHETVIAARSAILGLGKDSLSAFVSGEKNVIKNYDDAIAEAHANPSLVKTLTEQKQKAQKKIDEMERVKS